LLRKEKRSAEEEEEVERMESVESGFSTITHRICPRLWRFREASNSSTGSACHAWRGPRLQREGKGLRRLVAAGAKLVSLDLNDDDDDVPSPIIDSHF